MPTEHKTKILYIVTQSDFGGAQRYVYKLTTNLSAYFNIVVAGGEQGHEGELAKRLKEKKIKYIYLNHLFRAINPWHDLLSLCQIIKLIRAEKPDIIHLNSSKISILGSLAAFIAKPKIKNQKLKIIYTVHGWVFNEPLPRWQKLFYKYAEIFTALFKNKLICVSEYDRHVALEEKICPPNKLITINNGLEPINFITKNEALKKIYSHIHKSACANQPTKIVIGSLANLYPTKGLEYLIEAIHNISANRQSPIITIILGEGNERNKLEKLIKKHGLENHVLMPGNIPDAARLLPAFDIFVCSSVKEGFPFMVLEAMQAGLPIVSTNVGGLPEMLNNHKTGLLVNAQSPEELTCAINVLINNSELRKKIGLEAKFTVEKKFNLNKMLNETKQVYLGN